MEPLSGSGLREFSRYLVRDLALGSDTITTINLPIEFSRYLRNKGVSAIESEEYSERNRQNVINQLKELSEEWRLLGICPPFAVVQTEIVTWRHPRFREFSEMEPTPDHFPSVLRDIRASDSSRLLVYVACFLFCINCKRIYITDKSHDAGIDLIATFDSGPLSAVALFVQVKCGERTEGKKEAFLSEYSKFLLLRKLDQWKQYIKALRLHESRSGLCPIYLYITNAEFKPSIRESAVGLEAGLRTGRQLAATICEKLGEEQINSLLEELSPCSASLSLNLFDKIRRRVS